MDLFVRKHQKIINATLGCFDRMLFRGYLPIQSGWAMAQFLYQNQVPIRHLKDFLLENASRINEHAKAMAAKLSRPFQYLTAPTRKEDLARKMAENEISSMDWSAFSQCWNRAGLFPSGSKKAAPLSSLPEGNACSSTSTLWTENWV